MSLETKYFEILDAEMDGNQIILPVELEDGRRHEIVFTITEKRGYKKLAFYYFLSVGMPEAARSVIDKDLSLDFYKKTIGKEGLIKIEVENGSIETRSFLPRNYWPPEWMLYKLGHFASTAEAKFWLYYLEGLKGFKIEPQVSMDRYRLDFLVTHDDHQVCVEIDGKQHSEELEHDHERDRALFSRYGIPTARFSAREVMTDLKSCYQKMKDFFEGFKRGEE